MRSQLSLLHWAIAATHVTTGMYCPPVQQVDDIPSQPGQCVAIHGCIHGDGTTWSFDNSANTQSSCTTTLVALRCPQELATINPEGAVSKCDYSVLLFEDSGAVKHACCSDLHGTFQPSEDLQQIPFNSGGKENLKFEKADGIPNGEVSSLEGENDKELEVNDVEEWELEDDEEGELKDGEGELKDGEEELGNDEEEFEDGEGEGEFEDGEGEFEDGEGEGEFEDGEEEEDIKLELKDGKE